MTAPCDYQKPHETSRNLLETYMFDCMYSPFTKITHIVSSARLFGALSQSYLKGSLPGCSPHFAPNKT